MSTKMGIGSTLIIIGMMISGVSFWMALPWGIIITFLFIMLGRHLDEELKDER